jgi:hypothetical protein
MVVEVNLHSQSINILLEIFLVGGEVLLRVYTEAGIGRMDVLDVHAMEAGVIIPQFLLEHFLPIALFPLH